MTSPTPLPTCCSSDLKIPARSAFGVWVWSVSWASAGTVARMASIADAARMECERLNIVPSGTSHCEALL